MPNIIRKAAANNNPQKPGWQTTEFWLTVLTNVVIVVGQLVDILHLQPKTAAVVIAIVNAAYALARGLAKNNVAAPGTPSSVYMPATGNWGSGSGSHMNVQWTGSGQTEKASDVADEEPGDADALPEVPVADPKDVPRDEGDAGKPRAK